MKHKSLTLLKEFLDSGKSNQWLYTRELEVYVRRGYHAIEGDGTWCLDVANAKRLKPGSAYLEFVFGLPKILRCDVGYPQIIYVENVIMPGLDKLFRQLRYTQIGSEYHSICFYKKVTLP